MNMTWSPNYFIDGGTTEPMWGQTPPPPGQWQLNTILTVILSIVIAVLVITAFVSLCIYCMVKRRHAKNNQATDEQIVYVDSNGQRINTPVTRQIVEIFRAKKNKKQPVSVASTTPLEHAQVSVQNHVQEGGQYDVSISNISQQAIVATAAPQPPPQPDVDVPAPLPAPNPTPRPPPGTTIHSVGNEPVTPPPPAPAPDLGPAVYNVPVAACGNHGYTIQAAAFDIPEPTPAPIFMAHHHHHHSSTHNQNSTDQPSLVVAPQTQPSVPAAPQPYSAPPLPVPQPLPNVPPPPPPGQPQQYFAPPLPVPIPQGLPQQASVPYSPPSLGYPAPQPTYNPGFTFSGTLPSEYPAATQVPDATSTYGGGQGYAVSLPNISVQPGGGGSVNMGYTVHQ